MNNFDSSYTEKPKKSYFLAIVAAVGLLATLCTLRSVKGLCQDISDTLTMIAAGGSRDE